LKPTHRIVKRIFDFSLSLTLIPFLIIPILLLIVVSTVDTKIFGIFIQERIGCKGRKFSIYKIRTFNSNKEISLVGRFLRRSKLDEFPQLFNVLIGNMSFVGPRPDLEEITNTLKEEDAIILTVKPGITGPASIKYKNEEKILSNVKDHESLLNETIWSDKIEINKKYILEYRFINDLRYLLKTITP